MRIHWNVLCSVTLAAGLTLAAEAYAAHGQYSASIAGGAVSCEQAAQDLAKTFQKSVPSAKNVSGRCASDTIFTEANKTYHSYSLDVDYDADDFPSIYTATIAPDVLWDTVPAYSSYATCLADSANQGAKFSQATTLPALAVSCVLNSDESGTSYSMQIQGAGAPKQYLYRFEDLSHGTESPVTTDVSWSAGINNDLRAAGATIVMHSGITTYYYAAQPVNYSSSILEQFPNESLCNSQLEEGKKIVAATGAKHFSLACRHGDVTVELVMRGDFASVALENDYGTASPVFHSVDECFQNLSSVISKNSAIGGLCVPTDSNESLFQVNSFHLMH